MKKVRKNMRKKILKNKTLVIATMFVAALFVGVSISSVVANPARISREREEEIRSREEEIRSREEARAEAIRELEAARERAELTKPESNSEEEIVPPPIPPIPPIESESNSDVIDGDDLEKDPDPPIPPSISAETDSDYVTISIPKDLAMRLEEKMQSTQYATISAYIEYELEKIATEEDCVLCARSKEYISENSFLKITLDEKSDSIYALFKNNVYLGVTNDLSNEKLEEFRFGAGDILEDGLYQITNLNTGSIGGMVAGQIGGVGHTDGNGALASSNSNDDCISSCISMSVNTIGFLQEISQAIGDEYGPGAKAFFDATVMGATVGSAAAFLAWFVGSGPGVKAFALSFLLSLCGSSCPSGAGSGSSGFSNLVFPNSVAATTQASASSSTHATTALPASTVSTTQGSNVVSYGL
jgi:hypothetical protein